MSASADHLAAESARVESSASVCKRSRAQAWAVALGLVAVWYLLAQAFSAWMLGVAPGREAWLRDLVAHLIVGGVLFLMARSVGRFALAMVVVFSAFTLGNAIKLAVLGGPVMPDDVFAAKNLFLLLEGWQLWGSVAMLALPLAGLLWMFAWRQPRAWAALGGVVLAVSALVAHPGPASAWLDARFGDWLCGTSAATTRCAACRSTSCRRPRAISPAGARRRWRPRSMTR